MSEARRSVPRNFLGFSALWALLVAFLVAGIGFFVDQIATGGKWAVFALLGLPLARLVAGLIGRLYATTRRLAVEQQRKARTVYWVLLGLGLAALFVPALFASFWGDLGLPLLITGSIVGLVLIIASHIVDFQYSVRDFKRDL